MPKFKLLIWSLLIPQVAGALGSYFTTSEIEKWYFVLNKPSFTPPNWIFAPVWTTLFLLMGFALYFVWREGREKLAVKKAINIFFIQLVLNILWSMIFFGLHYPAGAFWEMILLLVFIILNIVHFYKIQKIAGILLIPYLVWVSFALVLNFSLWRLN